MILFVRRRGKRRYRIEVLGGEHILVKGEGHLTVTSALDDGRKRATGSHRSARHRECRKKRGVFFTSKANKKRTASLKAGLMQGTSKWNYNKGMENEVAKKKLKKERRK